MPELYADEEVQWEVYYRSYVDTYLQRDIRDLAQVADEMQFYNFMTIVAAHTAKPVVYQELADAAGISAPTAKKWLSILVSSHIIALVQPYHNNILKRVVKMPLLQFFETWVVSEIYKSYLNAGKEPPIFYISGQGSKGDRPAVLPERDIVSHRDQEGRFTRKERGQKFLCLGSGRYGRDL